MEYRENVKKILFQLEMDLRSGIGRRKKNVERVGGKCVSNKVSPINCCTRQTANKRVFPPTTPHQKHLLQIRFFFRREKGRKKENKLRENDHTQRKLEKQSSSRINLQSEKNPFDDGLFFCLHSLFLFILTQLAPI